MIFILNDNKFRNNISALKYEVMSLLNDVRASN